jgi:hypothetical protein
MLVLLMVGPAAWAHVGSKDVYETVDAGPYRLFVTIRPPIVIPGVAAVEVRVLGAAVRGIEMTPVPLVGEASKHPPTADRMTGSKEDPAFFTGAVWMMASGSWQVRLAVDGAAGVGTASVPVAAVPLATLKMKTGMIVGLGALGLFLLVSMAGLVGAAVREARLPPGAAPNPTWRRRAIAATAGTAVVLALVGLLGVKWFDVKAANYAETIYHPTPVAASLRGDVLDLKVTPANRDYLPDHGHLMHLYAIRQPEMDAVFHLHPELVAAGDFRITLPGMPAGTYALYGDVVHGTGFPETLVARLVVPEGLPANKLAAEDAEALPPPLSAGALGTSYKLPDGYTMIWDRPAAITATTPYVFRFRLVGPDGQPAKDMRPYLGMAGHAAFVKTDGTVFAHTHPEGSAAMAAMDMANGGMAGMHEAVGTEVGFPYGFPSAGAYRIFVQMKHGETVETGVFDARVQ